MTGEKLDLTHEEVEKIGKALKNPEFRNLLTDYCEELNDPAPVYRQRYQQEVIELEKQRGFNVTFIDPEPGYVIKTVSSFDDRKVFINVCSNQLIGDSRLMPHAVHTSSHGNMLWSVPHSLTPPRTDFDKSKQKCIVFDIVYHPNTLQLASSDKRFRKMINEIAIDSISSNFKIQLKKDRLRFPKMRYKGNAARPRPSIIREEIQMVQSNAAEPPPVVVEDDQVIADTIKPIYKLKYRHNIDFKDYLNDDRLDFDYRSGIVPKQVIIEIHVPGLQSTNQFVLDVQEKLLTFNSKQPIKYSLSIELPYEINTVSSKAQFFCDQHQLLVTLDVISNFQAKHIFASLI